MILIMLIKQSSYFFPTFSLILTFFIHYEFFWIHDTSEKIHRFTDQNNPDNLNSLSTTQKKVLRLIVHNKNNASN